MPDVLPFCKVPGLTFVILTQYRDGIFFRVRKRTGKKMPDIPASDFVEVLEDGKKYFLAHLGDVYSCTCEDWKAQTQRDERRRTCRHLRAYRGESEEQKRVDPLGEPPPLPADFFPGRRTLPRPDQLRSDARDVFDLELKEEGDDSGAEFDVGDWYMLIPYEDNIGAALEKARQEEFQANFSEFSSISEATLEPTGTVLDIKYVSDQGPPGLCTTAPLPPTVLMSVFGTTTPAVRMLNKKARARITRLLMEAWPLDDGPEFCLQSYYVVLYEKRGRNQVPTRIAFAGWYY
jgi:hypothetical protein